MFIPNKLIAINNNIDKIINLPETADKTFTYVTKVTVRESDSIIEILAKSGKKKRNQRFVINRLKKIYG